MVTKHETASVYAVRRFPDGWRIALIMHPRMRAWTVPGGHVEQFEDASETALRETKEEAGLVVALVCPPTPRLPESYPHVVVPAPWWSVSMHAGPDSVTSRTHVHLDRQYLAVTSEDPAPGSELQVRWFSAEDLRSATGILPDTHAQARVLLAVLDAHCQAVDPLDMARSIASHMIEPSAI